MAAHDKCEWNCGGTACDAPKRPPIEDGPAINLDHYAGTYGGHTTGRPKKHIDEVLTAWRVRRVQRKLAGLRAKLAAVRELVQLCHEGVPGALMLDMRDIPQEIAEVEELLRQLAA